MSVKYLSSLFVLTGSLAPIETSKLLGSTPHIFFVYGLKKILVNFSPTFDKNNSSVFFGFSIFFFILFNNLSASLSVFKDKSNISSKVVLFTGKGVVFPSSSKALTLCSYFTHDVNLLRNFMALEFSCPCNR